MYTWVLLYLFGLLANLPLQRPKPTHKHKNKKIIHVEYIFLLVSAITSGVKVPYVKYFPCVRGNFFFHRIICERKILSILGCILFMRIHEPKTVLYDHKNVYGPFRKSAIYFFFYRLEIEQV